MTVDTGLARLPARLLGDLVSPRALERIVGEAAQARGLTPAGLDAAALEDILKREVFKRLQLSVPAPLAKRRVSDVIAELHRAASEGAPPPLPGSNLTALEEGVRRFSLYFDWPETQRLRGVLGVARQEEDAGRDVTALVREGQDLIGLMERRLEEGLVTQAQDLAELRAAFARVQGMGGKDVRRLDNLIGQIDEAQRQGTLLPAEVERARTITFNLRKLLESSLVQPVTPQGAPVAPDPDARARVLALEQEHAGRLLADLTREFAALLRARPDLEERGAALREAHGAGSLGAEAALAWRTDLEAARDEAHGVQTAELARIEARLAALPESPALREARVALDVARLTLSGGGLAGDELRDLNATLGALEATPGDAGHVLAAQRELAEVERAARDVPGAAADLAPGLAAAREALGRGAVVDAAPLWAILERRMGEAARQREDFDARADFVIREYDTVRGLAGETTQRLGRLADTLRAQRRLGPMSQDARGRYAQTLEEAEALLHEAHAEYRAAQEVTATFGADALSDLLGVFDLGALGGETPQEAPGRQSPAPSAEAVGETWTAQDGLLKDGPHDPTAQGIAALLAQAAFLGLRQAQFEDDRGVWACVRLPNGSWRLARGQDAAALDRRAGAWPTGTHG
ncbi:hypothetical protein DAETH_00140 [Deinococcus aetherius]|uniref:DUF3375 domain-containing protein n=1 Tax=Deinococcus aetherius TaxID=200252 RepID=A0ABM8A8M3_9DEIO|nr:hypothetical protein [Deinococcus aetherius]BDP40045.1 hypothetical protein DAETH_00140 [Deinococcus aetherius]